MTKYNRRRRRKPMYFGNFYLNPSFQYMATIISAIALAGFVFSGFLLFRFTDEADLINQGKLQLMEGKIAWAAKTFTMLLNSHPDSYEGHLLLGEAYKELGERAKAEQEFLTAASLKSSKKDNAPDIALSKVDMTRGNFTQAEKRLKAVSQKDRQSQNVKEALCNLYETWGDTLKATGEPKSYLQVIEKYSLSLQYVTDVNTQQLLEKKQLETIYAYTRYLKSKKRYTEAIRQLKLSLRFKYQPETLIQIADTYQKINDLDSALEWYRKGFKISPNTVGLQLANSLIKKADQLKKENQLDAAQELFKEADEVGQEAKIPMDQLYPVKVRHVNINYKLDTVTGEFDPTVHVVLSNHSRRKLTFLRVKAEFFSGDQLLSKDIQGLEEPGDKDSKKTVFRQSNIKLAFQPERPIHLNSIYGSKMTVKIYVSYDADFDENTDWKLKSIQHAVINMSPPPEEEPESDSESDDNR